MICYSYHTNKMESTGGSYEFRRFIPREREYKGDSQYKNYINRWTVYEASDMDELKIKDIDNDIIREYYNGLPCRLGYILAGKTVEREAVLEIMDYIQGHNSISHIAILDAGGEGKTTALMQLVIKLLQIGKRVYFSQEAPELHIEFIDFEENDIIIIDNANHVANIHDLLNIAIKKGVRVIFAARANEWEIQKINVDLNRNIKEYKLSGFTEREKKEFAKLLVSYTQLSEEEIYEIFDNKSNQFLLAAMLRTMNGGINLEKIVEDIIKETKENLKGDYKEYALFILAIICLVEQAGAKMPMFLLRNICSNIGDGIKLKHMELVSIYLKKEVQHTSTYVETRHPIISELFYKNLIKFINIDLVYAELSNTDRNINKKGVDRVPDYLDIVGKVSLYLYDNYPEFLDLIDYVIDINLDSFFGQYQIQCKELFKIWIDIKIKALKDYDIEDSINALYEKATSKWFAGGNSEMWYRWAKYQTQRDNIGSVDKPYSARWIYHQALLNNQAEESILLGWAELEAIKGQYGDVNNPMAYTARWIYRWGMDNQKATENLVYNWAEMEEELGNFGDINTEYSARWIYHWGITNNAANENLLIKWADLEIEIANIGDVNQPYSALWIYHWGFKNGKIGENLLIKWAELEIYSKGLGDINTEYTGRWIFNWGLNNNKAEENLLIKWAEAEIEEDIQNAGQPQTPYTARWIYAYGLKSGKANANLIFKWIRLEMELNNIEPAHKEYTVLWLLDYAHMMLLDERSYWNWLIGVEMELGKVEQAYYHCKEAILNHDIHGLFALVQGERGILDDNEEGMEYLLHMATAKESPFGLYCLYLCDILYRDGQQAKEILERFYSLNGELSEYESRGYLRFWNNKVCN